MKHLGSKLFYPAFLVMGFALLTLFLWLMPAAHPEWAATCAIVLMIVVVFACERAFPLVEAWNQDQQGDTQVDILMTVMLFPIIVRACRFACEVALPDAGRIHLFAKGAPVLVQVVVCVLAAEFLFYWVHRISHENAFFWRFHAFHHRVKRVYWMNSGTCHPVDLTLNFLAYSIPFTLFDASPLAFEIGLFFSAVTGLLEHANVRFDAGVLNYVFNTAELHRWHHSVEIEESQTNYGKALSIWDSVFGTLFLPARRNGQAATPAAVGVDEAA